MFYFRWLPNGDTVFDPDADNVVEEDLFALRVSQVEGQDARMELVVKNPRIGPLAPDREQWARLSWAPIDGDTIVPLFHGRLQGLPEDLEGEKVTFTFQAHPNDFEAQKEALAETLRVDPWFDPIWFSDEDMKNPDTVLEGMSKLFVVDRVTGEVTVSDIITGEDDTVVFNPGEFFGLDIQQGSIPIRHVNVTAKVNWKQYAHVEVDITTKLRQAFAAVGSPNGQITSYTGQGLEKQWAVPGASIGGGWSYGETALNLLSGDGVTPDFVRIPVDPQPTDDVPNPEPFDALVYRWVFAIPKFTVIGTGSRDRIETVAFTLTGDIQNLRDDETEESVDIAFDSSNIALPVDANGVIPIDNVKRRSYFMTSRGRRSINWLISAARARLRSAARCVDVTAGIPFADAIEMTLRKNVTFNSDKIPGSSATGKVKSYQFSSEGGKIFGTVTIGCTIGTGGTAEDVDPGDPDYVEEGYVERGYQRYIGGSYTPHPDEVNYPDYTKPILDDGLNMVRMTADNIINGKRAEATLTFASNPTAGQTVTIGLITYTWRGSVGALTAPYDVLLGATKEDSLLHLGYAINGNSSFKGIYFTDGTEGHEIVVASTLIDDPTKLRVRARIGGTSANTLAVSESSAATSWNTATLTGGTGLGTGLVVLYGETEQKDALETPDVPFTDIKGIEDLLSDTDTGLWTRVQIDLKPIDGGGPYQTDFKLLPTHLKVPKTIDLEAA